MIHICKFRVDIQFPSIGDTPSKSHSIDRNPVTLPKVRYALLIIIKGILFLCRGIYLPVRVHIYIQMLVLSQVFPFLTLITSRSFILSHHTIHMIEYLGPKPSTTSIKTQNPRHCKQPSKINYPKVCKLKIVEKLRKEEARI